MKDTEEQYNWFLEVSGEPVAAALLTIADEMRRSRVLGMEDMPLSHNICIGIRKGLFGAQAGDDTSIVDGSLAVAEAVRDHG